MTTLVYDGSFEGLLTAVFEVYERRLQQIKLYTGTWRNSALFEDVVRIVTGEEKYKRVLTGLGKKISAAAIQHLYIAWLSETKGCDEAIVGYIRHVFDSPVNIEEDFGNKYVLRITELVQMVRRERHRMEAFVRFEKLADEIFYSAVEPDFNVLPLLIRHFKDRYADQKWIIYDIRRQYGIYYDLNDVEFMEIDFSKKNQASRTSSLQSEDEGLYQHLWKNYFTSVNIASRKNMKLHLRHIPKRYWKHLTEKI